MISRILSYWSDKSNQRLYHLSSSDITIGIYLPTLPGFHYRSNEYKTSNFFPIIRDQGIRGISTHKVYSPNRLPCWAVRSYRTFSPLPRKRGGYFLQH